MIRTCATLSVLMLSAIAEGYEHTPFDPDPRHVWNRIHEAFYIRIAADGTQYTAEELDPPLAPMTAYPLRSPGHQKIISLLDEFIETDADTLESDPLKRAIFQRDMWAVFDWTASRAEVWRRPRQPQFSDSRRALQLRLAEIVQRVALSREQIEALPDNYAATVTASLYPAAYDREAPENAFLPPGLTRSPSPWMLLGVDSRPNLIAPEHIEASMGRSAFLVFAQFPGDPGYLRRLQEYATPWVYSDFYKKYPRTGPSAFQMSRDLPQFSAGAQFILVRKTLLIDSSGALVISPLTESVEIRVYPTKPTNELFNDELTQKVYAFELDRKELFAGTSGGLRRLTNQDAALTTPPFGLWPAGRVDPLETDDSEIIRNFEMFPRISCRNCHNGSGIQSVRIYTGVKTFDQRRPPRLEPTGDLTREAARTIRWKEQQYSWGLLQGLWY